MTIPDAPIEERCKIFVNNCNKKDGYALNSIFRYVIFLKGRIEKKEIVVSTLHNHLKPIKLLCDMNDIVVKWRKITVGLPKERKYPEDRAPTIEEIRQLVEYSDRRLFAIVSTMISSGIRLAAWDDLKWKHVTPIQNELDGGVAAAKIIVYAGSEEQYFSFITPEAFHALKEWIHSIVEPIV